jgi:hypothetical protein
VSFWPVLNQGTPSALYCFLWLYISAAGAGPWSLDARRGVDTRLVGERQPRRERVTAGDR